MYGRIQLSLDELTEGRNQDADCPNEKTADPTGHQ